jgi:ribosomal-protein-alanine N-acetyltransferase
MMGFLPRTRVFVEEVRATAADGLAEIHGEVFARAWSADDLAVMLAPQNVFALALKRDSVFGLRRIAGFVLVRSAADEAEILTIAVRPGHRGRGYGRQLMEEALRRLYRERIAACFLEVDRGNTAALSLYRRLGFAEVGERKGYYPATAGEDGTALVMRLQLR